MGMASPERSILGRKPQPNRDRYIEILRSMTPEQRLLKSFELTEFARSLFKSGLKASHPEMSEAELHALYLGWARRWVSKTSSSR